MQNETINCLSNVFTVRDVMTPACQLKRSDTVDNAEHLFHEYDVVPYPRLGDVTGFFSRDTRRLHDLEPSHLISDSTSLFALPTLLKRHRFFFVISGNRIVGYVHYSDLNRGVMKIPFFAFFQLAEKNLWNRFKDRITENDLKIVFGADLAEKIATKRQGAMKSNVDIGWEGVFTFPWILKLARHFGLIHLTDDEISSLRNVRNKVAHSDRSLVDRFDDVAALTEAHELFLQIIDSV